LTERITERLRDELRTELQRETADACKVAERQGKKLEGFLANEIESHTCPICYELMIAPTYSPMILFPCGHTFCAECLQSHMVSHHRSKCPLCRQQIGSKALNHSLQDIIQQFVTQRERVMSGKQVEAGRRSSGHGLASSREGGVNSRAASIKTVDEADDDDDDPASQYGRQLRMLDMRCRILRNEVVESTEEKAQIAEKVTTARKVLRHMKDEEATLKAHIRQLMMEAEVVQEQVQEQERKQKALMQEEQAVQEKCDLILRTLAPLEQECEKLGVIVQGFSS